MFIKLTTCTSDGKDGLSICVDTGSIACLVQYPNNPDACMITFRNDILPSGLVKGSFEDISKMLMNKKG